MPGNLMSVHAVIHSVHYLHAASVAAFVTTQAVLLTTWAPTLAANSLYSSEVSRHL